MKRLARLSLLLAVAGTVLTFAPVVTVNAQTNKAPQITVAPFLQNIQINQSKDTSFSISYSNDSAQKQILNLSVADFGSLDDTGGVAFVGSEFGQLLDKYTLKPWVKLSESTITLNPGQKKAINATVVNDQEMGPGGHYGAVVASVESGEDKEGSRINLKQKVSSLIFAIKTGGEKYDIKLVDISSDANIFGLPSQVYVKIKSTGNVHVTPRGNVYIKSSDGKILAKGVINEESGFVLPDTDRIFTVKLNQLSSPKLWSNSYKVHVDYRYDGLDQFASKNHSAHYIDPRFALACILTLVGLIYTVKKQHFLLQKKSK